MSSHLPQLRSKRWVAVNVVLPTIFKVGTDFRWENLQFIRLVIPRSWLCHGLFVWEVLLYLIFEIYLVLSIYILHTKTFILVIQYYYLWFLEETCQRTKNCAPWPPTSTNQTSSTSSCISRTTMPSGTLKRSALLTVLVKEYCKIK